MDRLIKKPKDTTHNIRQMTTDWAQQKILGVLNPDLSNIPSHTTDGTTFCATSTKLEPDHNRNDTFRIAFRAHPLQAHVPRAETAIAISSVTELGDVHSSTTYVKRDLGFQGQLGQYILLSYGDTLFTDKDNSSTFRGIVSNSVAFATHDPTVVVDPTLDENGYPRQFVPLVSVWNENQSTHAVGITNVIETAPDQGVVFTLLNYRPHGTDNILGAGLAQVNLNTTTYPPTPSTTRLSPYIWDGNTEPWYGDVSVLKSNGYIYAYGHKKNNPWVYLTRVKTEQVTQVEWYEYWHGNETGWSNQRLLDPDIGEKQSVFWQINQGQIFWSNYFNRFLFIYCDNFWSSTILLRSSLHPEGPWSAAQTIYTAVPITNGGNVYAATVHPYLDDSGKTLVVGFTNYPNCIQMIKVVFA